MLAFSLLNFLVGNNKCYTEQLLRLVGLTRYIRRELTLVESAMLAMTTLSSMGIL